MLKTEEKIMAIEEIDINDDLKEKLIEELRDSLKDDLHGYVICDYLSRDEAEDILDDFDEWAENADWGDDYVYDENYYTLERPEDIDE